LLTGALCWAQNEMLIKRSYEVSNGDTTGRYDYDYDENYQLKTVIMFNNQGDTSNLWHYENDTIRYFTTYAGGYKTYVYTDDSIIQYNYDQSQVLAIYYLDDQDHVVHMYLQNVIPSDWYQDWTGNNITKQSWELYGTTYEYTVSYSEYLNPAYPPNRVIQNDIDCSYNMINKTYGDSGNEILYYDVVESVDNYPLKINVYHSNNFDHELCFEYLTINSTLEFAEEQKNILSINYYDLMGREIEKPNKGFYIELKTTDKGTVSKKRFIK